jgi:hypothetical protein
MLTDDQTPQTPEEAAIAHKREIMVLWAFAAVAVVVIGSLALDTFFYYS